MKHAPKMQLPYASWPAEDQRRWSAANEVGADRFDDCGRAAHLAEPTRRNLQASYGRFLGFVSLRHAVLLERAPDDRVDRQSIADYVAFRRPSCSDSGMAIEFRHLRHALIYICPESDWSWLATIATRIGSNAKSRPPKHHLVTSETLYALGLKLMDQTEASVENAARISKVDAMKYRDGLLIALVAEIPMRRRTVAALRIGEQLVKSGDLWELVIPAQDTKTRRALDFSISTELSRRIDRYLYQFRRRIPRAEMHGGLWPSNKGRPMDHGTIYDTVCRRTREALGFPINLHRFRSAAGTFWSIHDPLNVRGVKDLLGHASFDPTEKYYIMKQSRIAGHALARAMDRLK
jgi:integrase/recombinase XerD